MRNRTLLLSTLALGLIALVLAFTGHEATPPPAAAHPLVPAELLADLRAIEISTGGKTARAERTERGWIVPARFGLPVDADNRLRPLLQSLRNAKALGTLTTDPRRLARLGFEGNTVRLEGANGKVWSAEFGRTTDNAVGSAVRLVGAKEAIATNFLGYLEGDPANWIDPVLFAAKPDEVRALALTFPDGSKLRVERAKAGEAFGGAEPKLLAAAEDFLNYIVTIRAADAIARDDSAANAALTKPLIAEMTLWSGPTITLRLARDSATKAGEPPRGWLTASHSDPKHPLNRQTETALFTCPPWLAEQVAASAGEFAKRLDPPPAGAAPAGQGEPAIQLLPAGR